MAQSSNAAREPSMEEILASIRRIIEDSDVTRQTPPAPPPFTPRGAVAEFRRPAAPAIEPTPEKPPVAEKPVEKPEPPRPVFTSEPELRGAIAPTPPAPPVRDIEEEDDDALFLDAHNDDSRAAQAKAAPADDLAAIDRSVETGIAEALDEFLEPDMAEPPVAAKPEPKPAPAPQVRAPEVKAEVKAPVASSLKVPETPAAPPAPKPVEAAAPRAPEAAEPRGSILSDVAGRQVAAAFQDLDQAVREPRRSFDEIAAELLRPMLQDWLDNNLPNLVERLVREEIERVVRGGR